MFPYIFILHICPNSERFICEGNINVKNVSDE